MSSNINGFFWGGSVGVQTKAARTDPRPTACWLSRSTCAVTGTTARPAATPAAPCDRPLPRTPDPRRLPPDLRTWIYFVGSLGVQRGHCRKKNVGAPKVAHAGHAHFWGPFRHPALLSFHVTPSFSFYPSRFRPDLVLLSNLNFHSPDVAF